MAKLTLTDKAGVVSLGRVFEKAAGVATMMVLSRVISKVDYGLYWSVWAVYFLCLPVFQSGFRAAVIFYWPKIGPEERKQLVLQNLALLSVAGMAFSAMLFFGAPLIVQFFREPPPVALLRAFSLFPLFALPTLLAESVLLCADRPVLVAVTSFIARAVPFLVCIIAIAVLGWPLERAFVAVVVAAAVCLACILPVMLWPTRGSRFRWNLHRLIDQIKFAVPMGMSPLVAEFIRWTGILIVGRLYSQEWFGVFRNGATEVPVFPILAASATAVIMPQMSAHAGQGRLDLMIDVWQRAMRKVAFVVLPITMLLFVFGRETILVLFSSKYADSVPIFLVMVLVLPTRIANFMAPLIVTKRSKSVLAGSIAACAAIIGLTFGLGYLFRAIWPHNTALALLGPAVAILLTRVVWAGMFLAAITRFPGMSFGSVMPWRYLGRIVLIALPAVVAALAVKLPGDAMLEPLVRWLPAARGGHGIWIALARIGFGTLLFGIVYLVLAWVTDTVPPLERERLRTLWRRVRRAP